MPVGQVLPAAFQPGVSAGKELVEGEAAAETEDPALKLLKEIGEYRLDLACCIDVLVSHQEPVVEPVLEPELYTCGQFPGQCPENGAFAGDAGAETATWFQQ